jgi:hypothetical protein
LNSVMTEEMERNWIRNSKGVAKPWQNNNNWDCKIIWVGVGKCCRVD